MGFSARRTPLTALLSQCPERSVGVVSPITVYVQSSHGKILNVLQRLAKRRARLAVGLAPVHQFIGQMFDVRAYVQAPFVLIVAEGTGRDFEVRL